MSRRVEIQEEIVREEERLATVKSEVAAVTARLERLRSDLARLDPEATAPASRTEPPPETTPTSTREKLALFCSLFDSASLVDKA